MITQTQTQDVIGTTAYDADGDKIGKVGQLLLDDQTSQPAFITVHTGFFGTNESFIPVGDATFNGDRLTVPYDKQKIKDAPNVDLDAGHLDQDEERRLYDYYGMSDLYTGTQDGTYDATMSRDGDAAYAGRADGMSDGMADGRADGMSDGMADGRTADYTEGHDTSGPTTDDAMTRSEEHLNVGTTSRESGRARLRKYVTTENESQTVPVRKERAVVETEPVTAGSMDNAHDGPAISEEEHEVVLNEERVVVDKTVEPIERVRLGTETDVDQETVNEEVRKERIEVEGDADRV